MQRDQGVSTSSQVSMSPSTSELTPPSPIDNDDLYSSPICMKIKDGPNNPQDITDDFTFDLSYVPEIGILTQNMKQLTFDEEVTGDKEQEEAITCATKGENIFLTGRAGTGKSWATRRIVHSLSSAGKVVHVTAPTGMAAINVDGTTIHRWGGFGVGEYYADFDKMMDKENRQRIRKTHTLLIDEISMLSGH
eukprot:15287167-Ditylum_brightwellii.AAC.1